MKIEFFVPGKPATQGSKRHVGNGIMVDSCKHLKPWRLIVAQMAMIAMKDADVRILPPDACVMLECEFYMQRPKYHYRKNGEVKPGMPLFVTKKPDLLKMTRAIEDAMTGIVYRDDSQICLEKMSKQYVDRMPGVRVTVRVIR